VPESRAQSLIGTIARVELREACANRAWVLRAMVLPKRALTEESARAIQT